MWPLLAKSDLKVILVVGCWVTHQAREGQAGHVAVLPSHQGVQGTLWPGLSDNLGPELSCSWWAELALSLVGFWSLLGLGF